MRRKINIVTGGLRRKITLLVLVTLILVSISTIMVVSNRLQKLRELIINENNEQRDSVEEISTAYLERSVVDRAEKTSRLQANLVDTMFSDVSQKVEVLAERVAACFADDFDYSFLTVSTPDPADEGVIKLRLCYAPGVDPTTPENRKLIGKIALAEDLMCSLFKRGGLDNCYVGLPQGLGFVADDRMRDGEFARLLRQEGGVAARRDGPHFETVRMLPDHVQRLATDGSRRPEDGNSLPFHVA